MNAKLENITTQYRKFNENQALTEGQLNEFLDYFEDQDRLSRTRLSGVGVACGFQSTYTDLVLQPQAETKKPGTGDLELELNTIIITQGAGVTTDGDLITLRQPSVKPLETTVNFNAATYKYFRNYTDEVGYEHFRIGGHQIPLLELVTQAQYTQLKDKGAYVADFKHTKEIGSIYDKVMILYLESYSNEETPCQDADCDNTGAEQVSNLKVLLADSASVSGLMTKGDAKDTIYKAHNAYEELFDHLPKIEAKRVILDPAVKTATELRSRFQNATSTFAQLSDGFSAIADTFKVSINLGGETLLDRLKSLLAPTSRILADYQYRYDLLKDLIDTYNEIKGLILHLNAECCPDIASFPKHLLLGHVGAVSELGKYMPYRHGFYNSPINTTDDENYERVVMLANRFIQKINGFQSYTGAVKITPSNLYVRLGDKAIPYYYNVDKPLLTQWNFEKTKTDRETYNLSYHTINLASEDYVQNPLNYNIDNNDFYRIEGHLGQPYKTALQNINDLKAQYGLAFDVIALVLNKDGKSEGETPAKEKTVSIEDLRKQLTAISSDISNQKGGTQNTLLNISRLDDKLKLLNQAEFSKEGSSDGVTVVKQDPKKGDVVSEILSDFLERKSGLEHVAGVEPGGTFVLIYNNETDNQVLADFSLPYLCCSKKEPVFLVLPDSRLCQKDAPVAMTVVPENGEVKAFVNGVQIPAITQTAGQSFFNPGLVASTYLNQAIKFTVNDDAVEPQMIVYENPEITSVASGKVTYEKPTTNPNTTNPNASVEFNVVGNFAGLTFTWDFNDGSQIVQNEAPANLKTHVYKLIAGQEDTFNPTLTVTNANGCSTVYRLKPLKLVGQTTIACLTGMRVLIQYIDAKQGNHTCNEATFNLKGNGIIIGGSPNGNVFLSNTYESNDKKNYPAGYDKDTYRGPDRASEIIINKDEAQQIADKSPDGFISFSLECALTRCHTGVAWTQIFLADSKVPIYDGYPQNNFLSINPCTGETRK
ncbi:PKD domain-containing protein [Chryseobacterium sp. MEBOG06]|uniref:PKD domain-containing protein n=1 Tax=Chryseobacterium sp. MEBOG06 TaxID=2879938 RepID=UPI001F2CBAC1|nr:PKD domain-containing protein [Chryseobacterium sp. MEBOG06]UKB82414.1 PKD domain-containing protein [Chryseobacterium sp. MEBOG06]